MQLKAANGGFSVEHFDPGTAGILDAIRRQMLPHESPPITAELYALNVYTSGGHFAPHKDTPRGQDMFGTLACLEVGRANWQAMRNQLYRTGILV